MSRTWRKGEADYKHSQEYKNRRSNKKSKYNNTHREDAVNPDEYDRMKLNQAARRDFNYGLDTDLD
jgi:hypothetical protein